MKTHTALLQLYFDVRAWLRVADTFDDHFVLQITASGSEVRAAQLCLDPSAFLADSFALGRAAVLFSATLAPASYYKDLCGVPEARAVALRSPFPAGNQGLFCIGNVSTRYKDRDASLAIVEESLGDDGAGALRELSGVFPQLCVYGAGLCTVQGALPGNQLHQAGKRDG